METNILSNTLLSQLKNEIQGGERLLWNAQPIPSRSFIAAFAIYFFAIPWTAFALFWEFMAISPWFSGKAPPHGMESVGIIFPLFGLPFVLIGLGMLSAPFFARSQAKKTIYAITDRRAIIMNNGFRKDLRSYDLSKMGQEFERTERADGSGSLYFDIRNEYDSEGTRRRVKKGFECIENVKSAESKLRQAIEMAKTAT